MVNEFNFFQQLWPAISKDEAYILVGREGQNVSRIAHRISLTKNFERWLPDEAGGKGDTAYFQFHGEPEIY